jgi:hypothetical protein
MFKKIFKSKKAEVKSSNISKLSKTELVNVIGGTEVLTPKKGTGTGGCTGGTPMDAND